MQVNYRRVRCDAVNGSNNMLSPNRNFRIWFVISIQNQSWHTSQRGTLSKLWQVMSRMWYVNNDRWALIQRWFCCFAHSIECLNIVLNFWRVKNTLKFVGRKVFAGSLNNAITWLYGLSHASQYIYSIMYSWGSMKAHTHAQHGKEETILLMLMYCHQNCFCFRIDPWSMKSENQSIFIIIKMFRWQALPADERKNKLFLLA